jgi:hypothetical protein
LSGAKIDIEIIALKRGEKIMVANRLGAQEYAVIGLGRFGGSLARKLEDLGNTVLGIDRKIKVVQTIADEITQTVSQDATDEKALNEVNIASFDTAVVAIGDNVVVLLVRLFGRQVSLLDRLAVTSEFGLDKPTAIFVILRRSVIFMILIDAVGTISLYLHRRISGIVPPELELYQGIP